jgi:hypothetical protein
MINWLSGSRDRDKLIERKLQNKLQNLISNQLNVEGWDWKKSIRKSSPKKQESIRVNLLNSLPESWDWDRFIEIKKKIIKSHF